MTSEELDKKMREICHRVTDLIAEELRATDLSSPSVELAATYTAAVVAGMMMTVLHMPENVVQATLRIARTPGACTPFATIVTSAEFAAAKQREENAS